MEFQLLFFFFLALSVTFHAASGIPYGLNRTHGFCSIAATVCGLVAVILVAISALG